MKRIRGRDRRRKRKRVRIGPPDPTLTKFSGIAAVAELDDRLGMVETFDRHVGAWKQRERGGRDRSIVLG